MFDLQIKQEIVGNGPKENSLIMPLSFLIKICEILWETNCLAVYVYFL